MVIPGTAEGRTCVTSFTIGQLPHGALVVDGDGAIVEANPLAAAVLGLPEPVVGRSLADVVHVDDHAALSRALEPDGPDDDDDGGGTTAAVTLALDSGRHIEVSVSAVGAHRLVAVSDVTERVRTFRVLREALWTAVVIDDKGFRKWGPVGREHPEDRPNELPGSVVDRIHPEDVATMVQLHSAVLDRPGSRERATLRLRDLGQEAGGEGWGSGTIEMANLAHLPEVGGILVTVPDKVVVERIGSLGRTSSSYLSVAEAAPVGIILTGPAGFPAYFNDSSRRLLPGVGGGTAERDWTGFARPDARDELRAWVGDLVARGEQGSRTFPFVASETSWLLVTVAPRVVDDGVEGIAGFVITLQDVTPEVEAREALELAQERLVHMAHHDPLTSLPNRAVVAEALERSAVGGSSSAPAVGVLFGDLDGFKEVNDRLGHHAGDHVLVTVARRLEGVARASDLVARMGGDEFLVLADPIDPEELDELGRRLAAEVRRPIEVDGVTVSVGISLGAAMLRPGESTDDVLRRADALMYERKAGRRPQPEVTGTTTSSR